MNNRAAQDLTATNREIDALYSEFLHDFYGANRRARAEELAPRLEAALAASPEYASSIRGEEIRSLIAELRGDLVRAARCREAELRKILELHSLSANTPHWEYVARLYDHGDVSDRLDLLALLYDRQGDREAALATARESRDYCEAHLIPFDGQNLLAELEGAQEDREDGDPFTKDSADETQACLIGGISSTRTWSL